jgi:hypothetical protein
MIAQAFRGAESSVEVLKSAIDIQEVRVLANCGLR